MVLIFFFLTYWCRFLVDVVAIVVVSAAVLAVDIADVGLFAYPTVKC